MTSRKDISFLETASVQLFEILIVAGAPATGFFNTFKDATITQETLTRLRLMWQQANVLFIPPTDLNALHSMQCKSQGVGCGVIPQHIASDHAKLARYYIFLLFRYCISAAVRDSSFSIYTKPIDRQSGAQLPDIPPSWLDGRASIMYPSAPPNETIASFDTREIRPRNPLCQQQVPVYHDQPLWSQQQYNQPLTAANSAQVVHQRAYGVASYYNPSQIQQEDATLSIGRVHQQQAMVNNADAVRQHTRLYPTIPVAQQKINGSATKQSHGAYDSNYESD